MNKKQLKTVYIAIGLLSMILMSPPWQFRLKAKSVNTVVAGPYKFILVGAPEIPVASRSFGNKNTYFNNVKRSYWKAKIDLIRLIIPSIIVILIASGFVLYHKESIRGSKKNGEGKKGVFGFLKQDVHNKAASKVPGFKFLAGDGSTKDAAIKIIPNDIDSLIHSNLK